MSHPLHGRHVIVRLTFVISVCVLSYLLRLVLVFHDFVLVRLQSPCSPPDLSVPPTLAGSERRHWRMQGAWGACGVVGGGERRPGLASESIVCCRLCDVRHRPSKATTFL